MVFSENTLKFLFENKLHDSRTWFAEHKAEYNAFVLEPFVAFVKELAPTMLEIDPCMTVEPKVGKCISRIYRDVRFSNDKSIFRDAMWVTFMRDKRLFSDQPAYYFEISSGGFRYGCGYYNTSPAIMQNIRENAINNTPVFRRADEAIDSQDIFSFSGEKYKRSKYEQYPDKLRRWLDYKYFFLTHEGKSPAELYSPDLIPDIARAFKHIQPVYEFFMHCAAMPAK